METKNKKYRFITDTGLPIVIECPSYQVAEERFKDTFKNVRWIICSEA